MGHERGVDAAGTAVAAFDTSRRRRRCRRARPDSRRHHGRGPHRPRPLFADVVSVRTAGTPEHVARAHRRVPPRRARGESARRRPMAGFVRSATGRFVDVGPPAVAERAAAKAARPGHEEIRVGLVRRAARARPAAARVPDEHARAERGTLPPPDGRPSAAARAGRPR